MKKLLYFVSIVVFVCYMVWGCGKTTEDQQAQTPSPDAENIPTELPQDLSNQDRASLSDDHVAIVNGEKISVAEFAAQLHAVIRRSGETSAADAYSLQRFRETALQELIGKRLIAQKAREQQISVTDEEFQLLIRQVQEEYQGTDIQAILEEQGKSYAEWEQEQRDALLLEKLIDHNMQSMIVVTPEEIQQYYEHNKEKYDHPSQIRASQILTYEEDIAKKALQEIRSGDDFALVAQKYSESADAKDGGDLGFFSEGVMPPEFDEIVLSLKMGEVSDVIKTPYGYQIFKLTGRREAHRVGFDEAKTHIEHMLKQQKRMFAVDLWMVELQNNAEILLNHDVIKHIN